MGFLPPGLDPQQWAQMQHAKASGMPPMGPPPAGPGRDDQGPGQMTPKVMGMFGGPPHGAWGGAELRPRAGPHSARCLACAWRVAISIAAFEPSGG